MKNTITRLGILTGIFLFLYAGVNAQVSEIIRKSSIPNADYYQIKAEAEAYLNTLDYSDSSSIKEVKKVARWTTFWENRIHTDSASGIGDFTTYAYLTDKLIKGQIPITTKQAAPNWQLVGPLKDSYNFMETMWFQDIGLVSSIKPSPLFNTVNAMGDTNRFLLAGSNTGGLFYK